MNDGTGVRVRVEMLGPFQVRVDGQAVPAGGPKLRAIVALLALAGGRVVSVEDLLDGVWGEDLPATARNALQHHVKVFRKVLAGAGAADDLSTRDPGYALAAETDVGQFQAGVADARRAAVAGRAREAADRLSGALNLWRGHALADLRDFRFAADRAVALEEQRLTCLESWADAQLASGRADSLVPQLQELVIAHPTRERLWEQLMLALYRTGRQDAALSAYRTARATLDRELGVEPSTRLTSLHQAILVHDPKLRPGSAVTGPPGGMLSSTTLVRSEPTPTPAVLVGPGGRRVSLAGAAVVLGRHRDCDLVLTDGQASRRHARVEPVPAGYALVDLGSTNGTFLNGVRLSGAVVLGDGDRIEVGHSLVRFVLRATGAGSSPEADRHLAR